MHAMHVHWRQFLVGRVGLNAPDGWMAKYGCPRGALGQRALPQLNQKCYLCSDPYPVSRIPYPVSRIPYPVPVISHQSSVISHQSSVISHQSSVISHQSSLIHSRCFAVSNPWLSFHASAVYTLATPKVKGCASALVKPAVSISVHMSLPLGNCSMVPARYS